MIELEKVYYFFKATILSSPYDIILIKPTNSQNRRSWKIYTSIFKSNVY